MLAGATLLFADAAVAAPSTPPAAKRNKISFEKAEKIALSRVPGGVVEEIELDQYAGRLVYEVEVRAPDGREHEIVIDAYDGRILAEKIDD